MANCSGARGIAQAFTNTRQQIQHFALSNTRPFGYHRACRALPVRAVKQGKGCMQKRGFFHELRRRNVFRMAGLYVVAAWLILQVSGTVLPMLDAPAWIPRTLLFLLALGFVPALIFSWVFELTPEGLRREGDVPAGQSIMSETGQRMNHMIIAALVLALAFFGFDKFVLTPKREAALVSSAHEEAAKQAPVPPPPA